MVVVLVALVAIVALATYVGYKYGQKVEAEYTAAFQAAHNSVSAKLDAVKAEVARLESIVVGEAAAAVARIKVLL